MERLILERLKMIGFFLSLISIIMLGASCGGNNWVKLGDKSFGLWKMCTESECHSIDDNFFDDGEVPDWFNVTRSFVVIASILLFAGFVITLTNRVLVAAIVYILSAVFLMIGLSVFVDRVSYKFAVFHYDWSFKLGWASFVTLSMAGGFSILGTDGIVEKLQRRANHVVIVGSFTVFVLSIISCASHSWVQAKEEGIGMDVFYHQGLWKICSKFVSFGRVKTDLCTSYSDYYRLLNKDIPSWVYVTRLFSVLACLSSGFATCCALASMKLTRLKKEIASCLMLTATISLIISLSYFTDVTRSKVTSIATYRFSWGYIIGWIGLVISLDVSFIGFLRFIFPWAQTLSHQVFENEPE